MAEDKLKIVAEQKPTQESPRSYSGGKSRRLEAQAIADRIWLQNPQAFDPKRNAMERLRLERTLELVTETIDLKGKRACDLGCGQGDFTRALRDQGAEVDAVDISPLALKALQQGDMTRIKAYQDYVPMTTLKDNAYTLVACLELIADLRHDEHRLLFSELARLVSNEGYVVCSTALDVHSEDALARYTQLAETELQITAWKVGYHRLWIALKNGLQTPARYYRASRDSDYRHRKLEQRSPLSRAWFGLNSTRPLGLFWGGIAVLFHPLLTFFKHNRTLLLLCEKISRFWWSDAGISHAILIGQKRPLFQHLPKDEIPKETKHKRQVWE